MLVLGPTVSLFWHFLIIFIEKIDKNCKLSCMLEQEFHFYWQFGDKVLASKSFSSTILKV